MKNTLRVNKETDLYNHGGLATSKSKKSTEVFKPRKKHPREALPPASDLWDRGVYNGLELRPFTGRPGAMDAFALPSRGIKA